MKIQNVIILFYLFLSVIIGALMVGFSLHLIEIGNLTFHINELYYNNNARIALATTGIALVGLALFFVQATSERREREKTIAFNNPSGQVTITLFAVEDLIRKISHELPQIKELRPDVVATKKRGLQVRVRLILKSAVNIPTFTTQLQAMIQNRMQETLGIDEQITVKIHIAKILTQQEKPKKNKESEEIIPPSLQEEIQVPFPRK